MGTGNLLDILNRPSNTTHAPERPGDNTAMDEFKQKTAGRNGGGLKSVLDGLEEMWDDSQYAEEFSLETFVKKLQ